MPFLLFLFFFLSFVIFRQLIIYNNASSLRSRRCLSFSSSRALCYLFIMRRSYREVCFFARCNLTNVRLVHVCRVTRECSYRSAILISNFIYAVSESVNRDMGLFLFPVELFEIRIYMWLGGRGFVNVDYKKQAWTRGCHCFSSFRVRILLGQCASEIIHGISSVLLFRNTIVSVINVCFIYI